MRLPKDVYAAVDERKVDVFYADRRLCAMWNGNRRTDELRYYAGWYWAIQQHGRIEVGADGVADHGPYHSKSAAYKDAFLELSLRRQRKQPTQQVTGGNIVRMKVPTSKLSAREDHALRRQLRRVGVR